MTFDPSIVAEAAADRRLRLFTLYADFAAAERARWAAGRLSQLAGEQWESCTEMWHLNSLVAGEANLAHDAAHADVLIVAVSSLEWRESKLTQWLDSLVVTNDRSRFCGLLIGLLGDEHNQSGELDWTVKQLLRQARRTDRDFIWHWMGAEAMTDDDWLVDCMEALLARKCLVGDVPFLQDTAWRMA